MPLSFCSTDWFKLLEVPHLLLQGFRPVLSKQHVCIYLSSRHADVAVDDRGKHDDDGDDDEDDDEDDDGGGGGGGGSETDQQKCPSLQQIPDETEDDVKTACRSSQ